MAVDAVEHAGQARRVVPQEAVEPGHAKAAIDAGVVDDVAPLDEIAPRLRYL